MKPAMRGMLVPAALCGAVTAADERLPSADTVLRELQAGNDRHVKRYQHPNRTDARQHELVMGHQKSAR